MSKSTKALLREHPFNPAEIPERMIWTSSALKTFRKCKRMFFWRYIMRLKPRAKGTALIIGSAAHEALEEWYTRKRASMEGICSRHRTKAEKTFHGDSAQFYGQKQIDDAMKDLTTFDGMMLGYGDVYSRERKEWKILKKNVERQFSMDMGPFDFQGKIDLIAAEGNKWFVVEHKTAAQIPDSYIERLPLDTQVKAYTFAAIEAFDIPVKHVLYDVIRKCRLRRKANESPEEFNKRIRVDYGARPDFYFFREMLKFSPSDIKAFVHDMRMTHEEYQHILDTRDPTLPESWPMSDHAYTEYNHISPYALLSVQGLNRGSAMMFEQDTVLHTELEETG